MHAERAHRILETRTGRTLEWGGAPDPGAFAALMRASWAENRESTLDYDESFLRSCLGYPGTMPIMAPGLYDSEKLAATVFGTPRRVMLRGRERNLLLMTFFTVAPEWKGQGLGVATWGECLRQAREAGYDGAIHFCSEGHISNHVTAAGAQKAGLTAIRVFTVRFLMRRLTAQRIGPPEWPEPVIEDFLAAAAAAPLHAPLARLWTATEATWQCLSRAGAIAVTRRQGDSCGALAGYKIRSLDSERTRCAFIDDILWHNVDRPCRAELLHKFLVAAEQDSDVAAAPILSYTDMSPFLEAGFRRSLRVLHVYLTMWNGDDESSLPSLYLDVI